MCGKDEENLETFMRIHKKPAAHFINYVAEKTVLVGLGTSYLLLP